MNNIKIILVLLFLLKINTSFSQSIKPSEYNNFTPTIIDELEGNQTIINIAPQSNQGFSINQFS